MEGFVPLGQPVWTAVLSQLMTGAIWVRGGTLLNCTKYIMVAHMPGMQFLDFSVWDVLKENSKHFKGSKLNYEWSTPTSPWKWCLASDYEEELFQLFVNKWFGLNRKVAGWGPGGSKVLMFFACWDLLKFGEDFQYLETLKLWKCVTLTPTPRDLERTGCS